MPQEFKGFHTNPEDIVAGRVTDPDKARVMAEQGQEDGSREHITHVRTIDPSKFEGGEEGKKRFIKALENEADMLEENSGYIYDQEQKMRQEMGIDTKSDAELEELLRLLQAKSKELDSRFHKDESKHEQQTRVGVGMKAYYVGKELKVRRLSQGIKDKMP